MSLNKKLPDIPGLLKVYIKLILELVYRFGVY